MPSRRAELEMLNMLSQVLAHYWLYCRNITARGSAKLGDASAKIQPWALWLVTPLCCIWLSLLCRPPKWIENFSPEEFLFICFLQLSRGKACFIFLHIWQLEKNRRVETEIKDFKVKKKNFFKFCFQRKCIFRPYLICWEQKRCFRIKLKFSGLSVSNE